MLVEREKPLTEMIACAKTARSEHGRVIALCGEAGVGKTSLLDEFRAHVGGEFEIFWGACDALATPRPFGPLHDMAPAFGSPVSDVLADSTSSADIFATVLNEVGARAEPSIIIIEDIHWADQATLDFIKYLGRRIALLRAVLVVSFRDDEPAQPHDPGLVFGDIPATNIHRIELTPLSQKGVRSVCGHGGVDSEAVFRITGGNPFFVAEVLAAGDASPNKIPPSVMEAVSGRIARLGDGEREFLETIAVIPGLVRPKLVGALFGDQGDTFVMACVGRNFLMQSANGMLRFRHELTRLATLSRLSSTKQKIVHRRILDAYDAIDETPPIDQLVHHAAGALDGPRALALAPQAAALAASMGAHREAAAHLRTALQYVDEAAPETAAQLYQDWAYEAGLADRIDDEVLEARRHSLTLWRALDRHGNVGENLRWLSRLHWYRGEAAKAKRYADEAVRVLEATTPSAERAMAYSLRSQMHMLHDEMDEATAWGERALELADRFDNTEAKIHALNNIGTAKIFRGDKEGVAQMRESLKLALAHDMHEHAARVYTNLAEYAVEFYDFALAEETLAEGIAFDNRNDLASWTHYLVGRLAQLRLEQGRLHDAETIARGVMNLPQLTLLMKLPALTTLAKARLRLGANDAEKLLAEALGAAAATDEAQYIVPVRLSLIEAAWLHDDLGAARRECRRVMEIAAENMHHWHSGEAAVWAHRLGESAPAGFLRNLPRPHALERRGDNAAAAAEWRAIGAPYAAVIALIASPDAPGADTMADCIKSCQSLGARAGEAKARSIAERSGVTQAMPKVKRGPYQASRHHPLGLTKREQEILRLICSGKNNVVIAERLSRSIKTIEHHGTSIFRKLNVSNRMEAMLRVQSEPWLVPDQQAPKSRR